MDNQTDNSINGIYILNPKLNQQQLNDAISAYLSKAEALAITAATTNFEAYTTEVLTNYLWALSDTIREAQWLHEKFSIVARTYPQSPDLLRNPASCG